MKMLCSTGTMVGKNNSYNYRLINRYFPLLLDKGIIDGGEFMMVNVFYPIINSVVSDVKRTNVPFYVFHCDKDIGILLSYKEKGKTDKAIDFFEKNCEAANKLSVNKMVFHLWGGEKSDTNIEYNISILPTLINTAEKYGIKLLIENIPCREKTGLAVFDMLKPFTPDIGFIYDTRFGEFHNETNEILNSDCWDNIHHIHISDWGSYTKDFSSLRPILHPGEGKIDFENIFEKVREKGYDETVTMESPVISKFQPDIDKLMKSILYIKNLF